jgi:hypothetical protein
VNLIARLDAATPPHRDRTVDALRAFAIVGVVLGHWLVSALVSDPSRPAAWHGASPLEGRPALIPATWFLQTLSLFFFAGGYAAARRTAARRAATRETAPSWAAAREGDAVGAAVNGAGRAGGWSRVAGRAGRLARPVTALAAVWVPAWLLLRVTGAPGSTLHVVASLLVHPMWFLLVYLALSVCSPVLRAAVARYGLWPVAPSIALVAVSDVVRRLDAASWLHPVATVGGWAAPYLLGIALASGRLPRRAGPVLAPAGVIAGALLVLVAGYPASAVGVPGDGWPWPRRRSACSCWSGTGSPAGCGDRRSGRRSPFSTWRP